MLFEHLCWLTRISIIVCTSLWSRQNLVEFSAHCYVCHFLDTSKDNKKLWLDDENNITWIDNFGHFHGRYHESDTHNGFPFQDYWLPGFLLSSSPSTSTKWHTQQCAENLTPTKIVLVLPTPQRSPNNKRIIIYGDLKLLPWVKNVIERNRT